MDRSEDQCCLTEIADIFEQKSTSFLFTNPFICCDKITRAREYIYNHICDDSKKKYNLSHPEH